MLNLIPAALVAAAPAAPAQMPADAHAQHHSAPQGHEQHQKMAQMAKECCCKEMMEKMHSGHDMTRMQDHQDHKTQ